MFHLKRSSFCLAVPKCSDLSLVIGRGQPIGQVDYFSDTGMLQKQMGKPGCPCLVRKWFCNAVVM